MGISATELVALVVPWYALSMGYNVYNQLMKPDMPFSLVISMVQLPVGLPYALGLWVLGYRKWPKLTLADVVKILPIVFFNMVGHVATVVAMFQVGGGSATHVVKASEPVVVVLLNVVINGVLPKPLTALSLLPIVYGVSYAATLGNLSISTMSKDLTTVSAKLGLVSNFAFALRSVLRKRLDADFKKRTNMDSDNEFAVTTIMTILLVLPFCILGTGNKDAMSDIFAHYDKLGTARANNFLFNTALCGACFYLYNELQSKVLEKTDAVTMAVGNTLKRVAIFVGFWLFNNEAFPPAKTLGCTIAVVGCLAYGIFDSKKI